MRKPESVGGVILNSKGQVVVVNQDGTSWSLPKGHARRDESDEEAALREILEETGLSELKLIRKLETYERSKLDSSGEQDEREIKIIHMFLFSTDQEKLNPSDTRITEARWIEKDEVADILTHPKDKEFFLKSLNSI